MDKTTMIYCGCAIVVILIVAVLLVKTEGFLQAATATATPTLTSSLTSAQFNLLSTQDYLNLIVDKTAQLNLYLSGDALAMLSSPTNVFKLISSINNLQLMSAPMPCLVTLKAGIPAHVDQQYNGFFEFTSPASSSNTVSQPFGKTLAYTYNDMEQLYRKIQRLTGVGGVPPHVDLQMVENAAL